MLRVLNSHVDCVCHSMGEFAKMCMLNCESISAISDAVPDAVPVTKSEVDEVVFDESICFQSFQII